MCSIWLDLEKLDLCLYVCSHKAVCGLHIPKDNLVTLGIVCRGSVSKFQPSGNSRKEQQRTELTVGDYNLSPGALHARLRCIIPYRPKERWPPNKIDVHSGEHHSIARSVFESIWSPTKWIVATS